MNKKGQISSEFLVILGVVLVVAMVAVGLTLLFSQSSRDISENEARAYWASQVQPLRLLEYEGFYYAGAPTLGELALVIENVDSKPITLRSLVLSPYGDETSFIVYSTHSASGALGTELLPSHDSGPDNLDGLNVELAPSEKLTVYLRTETSCATQRIARANTNNFESNLTIYYDTPYFTGLSFEGLKPISGRCNQN